MAEYMTIKVSDPEKHGDGAKAYTTYQITVKTNAREYNDVESIVRRRFSDFQWLHGALESQALGVWVPPMPEKKAMGRFADDFINQRMRGLNQFCQRIAAHPVLRKMDCVVSFFTAKHWELKSQKSGDDGGFQKLIKKVTLETDAVVLSTSAHKARIQEMDPDHKEFDTLKAYIGEFEKSVSSMNKAMANLVKKQHEMSDDYNSMAQSLLHIAQGETDLTESLDSFGQVCQEIASLFTQQSQRDDENTVETLKEYIGYAQSAQRCVKVRDQVLGKYEEASSRLTKYTAQLEKEVDEKEKRDKEIEEDPTKKKKGGWFSKDPDAKLEKTKKNHAEAENDVENTQKYFEETTETMQAEVQRFHNNKLRDFQNMMLTYVRSQMSFNQKCKEQWENLLPTIHCLDEKETASPGYGRIKAKSTVSRKGSDIPVEEDATLTMKSSSKSRPLSNSKFGDEAAFGQKRPSASSQADDEIFAPAAISKSMNEEIAEAEEDDSAMMTASKDELTL